MPGLADCAASNRQAPLLFLGRFAAALVLGWIVGLVLALILAFALNDGKVEQIPVFTVPAGLVITYLVSFLVVRPRFFR